jgi:hypothetical protein
LYKKIILKISRILIFRLVQWLKGQWYLHAREYLNASSVFCQLRENSVLKDDITNLVSQGMTYFLAGDFPNALVPLQRVNLSFQD